MKAEAYRTIEPTLAERARAILTRAMVSLRYERVVGTQYRSAMFYKTETELDEFKAAIERAKEIWNGQIVTELTPAATFWVGEEYHQDFFAKNPNQGYCNAVVAPKMAKTRKAFMSYMRD